MDRSITGENVAIWAIAKNAKMLTKEFLVIDLNKIK